MAKTNIIKLNDLPNPFNVKVTPKASRNEIKITDAGEIKIYITTVPEAGKANKMVIALLAKSLGIAKSKLSIIRGETNKQKTIKIND